ncbi:HVA1 family protein [Rhodanobacter sp. 115]|uniref:HVA1 family protein n=1 Tax=Rhodanobacter sp. FW021-MT20 TaxID=1162282 RepID=UPI000260F8C9|nr:hypothetical protein UU5_12448 [Rhodanobacter sp. 115]
MPTSPALPVFTIGHSTRPIEDFLALLAENSVEEIVDVRRLPGSRRHPQYDQDTLRETLAAHGIGYRHIATLGGRRGGRTAESRNTWWEHPAFRRYADYALTAAFREGLAELLACSARRRCAVMCAEAVWWRCHRRIVTDYLLHAGREVWHILGPHHAEHAAMTPAAQACGEGLIYPGLISPDHSIREEPAMARTYQVGDHVSWNSEAGRVRGTITKVHTSDVNWKGYTHHASKDDPQYEIRSDKTDHVALHKGKPLRKLKTPAPPRDD